MAIKRDTNKPPCVANGHGDITGAARQAASGAVRAGSHGIGMILRSPAFLKPVLARRGMEPRDEQAG